MSLPEKLLWRRLKTSGFVDGPRFRRQHPVSGFLLHAGAALHRDRWGGAIDISMI
ncbi:hypothetical protein [Phenylobacterium sp. LjRoot219]|uniref:hypothetical protein n=1 Tax=Phenylobacterium sp. LjRoot219 TaxID=3342283 RepID=UPI003F50103A